MSEAISKIGRVVDGWVCLEYVTTTKGGRIYRWKHSCGKIVVKSECDVRLRKGTCCPCRPGKVGGNTTIYHHTPTGNTYRSMIARCTNPNHTAFHRYGGKGIGVDPLWLIYENFLADMGERPAGLELDRIDNTLGYSKANCRWVTRRDNIRNTSVNRRFEYKGRMLCVAEIAELAGVSYHCAWSRLVKHGFSVERTINKGVR